MTPVLGRIILYSHNIPETADFYCRLFGYSSVLQEGDGILELRPAAQGLTLLLHPAAKGQKSGQVLLKLVFDVADVAGFCRQAAEFGVVFGPLHSARGYVFANAKDPSGNSISVSSRAFGQPGGALTA
ncbi:VOC family protein [Pseudorhodobacter sp.]|uniref:VOC family protein n=1 Tax=Pseudorhodobacter sp. TaxID=1934400 RepID=UPI002649A773|nr:VOC family protein [Pseudorhodobacter sp.]MDN5786815.1 VOC family protein [Pseudorhodobacter sp.]